MHTNKMNTKYVSVSRVIHISYIPLEKSAKNILFLISKGILDQISTTLYFV